MRTHWLNNVMLKGSGKTRLLAGFLMTAAMVLAQGYPQGAPPQGQYPPPQAQVGAPGAPGEAAPVDEPGRAVARLGILNGDASIRRGDSTDWVAAAVNAPLMSGDQISVAAGGRAFWRPAMVGFIGWGGGIGVGFGFGNIGWIPLAPFEVYHPWYGRGFGGRGLIGVNMVRNVNVAGSFRNAGVAGGVTGVTAADFQRGNFRSTVAVDRAALGQASVAHGALPVTPTSQNLAFSNRTASVQPARSTTSMASQRFYSTSNASVQRTPFAQQQAAVRASVTGGAAGAGRSAAVPAGPGASAGANWQRFQGTPSAGAARPAGAPGAAVPAPGFNRFNGPQGGARSAPQQGGQYSQPRSYQVSPSIVRPRPESAPQQQAQPSYQSRPQAAPAPAQGGAYGGGRSYAAPAPAPAQRSAPAGGGSRQSSGGSHGGGGHR